MLQITITDKYNNNHGFVFQDQLRVDAYFKSIERDQPWGMNGYWTESLTEVEGTTHSRQSTKTIRDIETNEFVEVEITEWYTPAEWTYTQEDITEALELRRQSQEALDYLRSTDWLIIREIDIGVPCSSDVKTLRAAARLKVLP